ncbi:MAG: nucleoside hydrolase [Phycisphaerae bacterium]|nr:nucleoside hydrolase [Phycisphaerae bacterium]
MRRVIPPIVVSLWLLAVAGPPEAWCSDHQAQAHSIPVIYSTDLFHPHDDPDDHYDLATLFALPELDVKAVVLDLGDRQKLKPGRLPLEQMMHMTGRRVPFATGLSGRLKTPADKAVDQPAEDQAGVELLLATLRESGQPVTIFTTGSLRDVCAAFNRQPDLFRAKVARLYINIGSTDNTVEWNVTLDLNAYLGVMRSGLPIYWCPCLPMKVNERSTYWTFRQSEILETLPQPMLSYFVYALQQVKPEELDPIKALDSDLRPWRHLIGTMDRNMWCTAPFLHAAGRQVYRRGEEFTSATTRPAGLQTPELFTFTPARVEIDPRGRTQSVIHEPDGLIQVFLVTNTTLYQKAMTDCLRSLLQAARTGRTDASESRPVAP